MGQTLTWTGQVQCDAVHVMTEGSLETLGSWQCFVVLFHEVMGM